MLPVYTFIGAIVFQVSDCCLQISLFAHLQALDGDHDAAMQLEHANLCTEDRETRLAALTTVCAQLTADACIDRFRALLLDIDTCYRGWHATDDIDSHSMAHFTSEWNS